MTFTNTSIRNISIALVAVLFAATFLAVAPVAKAADLDIGGGDYGGWSTDYFTDYSSPSYDNYGGWSTDYYTDYSSPSYGGGSYGGGMGGWSYPVSSFGGFGGYGGSSSSFTNTNVNQNYNSNYCTNGSCNTAINAPTTVTVANSQPTYPVYQPVYQPVYTSVVPTYAPAQYDVCPNLPGIQPSLMPGYYIQNGYCYQNYAPNYQQPYVTLSAVPYTGLELGPVGTALYWGFLVLWCLMAAYLIAVKKVHNKIAAWFAGSKAEHTVVSHAQVAPAAPAKVAPQYDGIDPFIASQIHRA